MTRKIKTMIAIMMSLTLMLAMTACGSKEEPAEESTEEPAGEEPAEEFTEEQAGE